MILKFSKGKVSSSGGGGQITGEKIPGDLDSWNLYQQDINDALNASYGILSQRSVSLFHTYPPAASAINKTTAYAIGAGNIFRSRPDHRILGITPQEAKEWGKRFQLLVHYYFEKMSWYEKQAVTFKGALISGDSLVFFIRDKDSFDLIEAGGNNIDWEHANGQDWTLGIKHDKYKRKKAIYTDKAINFQNQKTGDQQVIQFYLKDMPRQLRGLPLAYKIIALAKNHDREIDATVQRAVLESIMMAYSNTDQTDFGKQLQQQAQASSRKKKNGLSNVWNRLTGTKEIQGGSIYQLKTGESINFTDLKTPGNNFDKFQDAMINFVAMATDTTPGIIKSNYPTSYSSHKGEFNDFWKMVKLKRGVFNKNVNKVIIKEIAKELILNGTIKAP